MSRPRKDRDQHALMVLLTEPDHPGASVMDAWDKVPGESIHKYKWFLKYRDMGPGRSISKLATEWHFSRSTLYHMCNNYRWVERVGAWDEWLDRQFIAELNEKRRAAVSSHLDISQDMISKICERMATLNPANLSPGHVSIWFDLAVKVQRVSLGLETLAKDGSVVFNQVVNNNQQNTHNTAIVASEEMEEKISAYADVFRRLEETQRTSVQQENDRGSSPGLPLSEGKG